MMKEINESANFSMMKPMHTILSGVKVLWGNVAVEGIKRIREALGAAGFLT